MSLQTRLEAFAAAVGADIKALQQSSGGSPTQSITYVTGDQTLTSTQYLVSAGPGTMTITLPPTTSSNAQGRSYTIVNAGSGAVTLVSAEGSANILNRTSYRLQPKDSVELFTTGSAWWARADSMGDVLSAAADYSNTTPPAPASGISLFSRKRARRIPAFVGPTGMDSQLQPALFSNRIAELFANPTQPNPGALCITATNNAAPTAVTPTAPNAAGGLGGSVHRHRYSTAATTAGSAAGFRVQGQHLYMTNVANAGGFFIVMRWVTGANINRFAFGVQGATAAIPFTADTRGAISNFIGFSKNQNDAQIWMFSSAAAASSYTTWATGIAPSIAGGLYEARLFCPSGSGSYVDWSLQEVSTGAYAEGRVDVTMPANNTPLFVHMEASNGATAGTGYFDLQSLYIETDN